MIAGYNDDLYAGEVDSITGGTFAGAVDDFSSMDSNVRDAGRGGDDGNDTPPRKSVFVGVIRNICLCVPVTLAIAVGILGLIHLMRKSTVLVDGDGNGKEGGKSLTSGLHAPSNLEELCAEDAVTADAVSYSSCEDACEVASCCHDTNAENNCALDFPLLCEEYSPCDILRHFSDAYHDDQGIDESLLTDEGPFSDTTTVPSAPSNLEETCSNVNVDGRDGEALDKLAECDMACLEAECCWANEDSHNCYSSNADSCGEYEPCSSVNGGYSPGPPDVAMSMRDQSKPENVSNKSNFHPIVEDLCSLESLTSEFGLERCRAVCDERACCFRSLELEGCDTVENDDWCMEYEPCRPAMEVDVAEETVDALCSANRVEDDENAFNRCVDMCMGRECCFLLKDNCDTADNDDWCMEYEACRSVMKHVMGQQ